MMTYNSCIHVHWAVVLVMISTSTSTPVWLSSSSSSSTIHLWQSWCQPQGSRGMSGRLYSNIDQGNMNISYTELYQFSMQWSLYTCVLTQYMYVRACLFWIPIQRGALHVRSWLSVDQIFNSVRPAWLSYVWWFNWHAYNCFNYTSI